MPKLIDLTGRVYGRLRVIERGETTGEGNSRRVYWWCLCDPSLGGCGREKQVAGQLLRRDEVVSCGCYRQEWAAGEAVLEGRPPPPKPLEIEYEYTCAVCGAEFVGPPNCVSCSPQCTRAHRTRYERERRKNTE